MKFLLGKDFCLWVVSSKTGCVKKVRFTLARGLAIFLISSAILLGLLYVASDYSRVQIARAFSSLHLKKALQEKGELASKNQSLAEELQSLQKRHEAAISYESSIKSKLESLSSIVDSATSMGLLKERALPGNRRDEGVGGLEVDCLKKPTKDCPPLDLDARAQFRPSAFAALDKGEIKGEEPLTSVLDRYINVLKSLPLAAPVKTGHITSNFGFRYSPFGGGLRMHKGVDYSLEDDGAVLATGDGVVRAVERTGTYGLVIDVYHQRHVLTRYAHLSKALVSEGDKVVRGQKIAIGGSTGRSTGPHLHYEVRLHGMTRDPIDFLLLADKLASILHTS